MATTRTALLSILLAGCATNERVQQLEDRVEALEKKAAEAPAPAPSANAAAKKSAPAADSATDEAAKEVYMGIAQAIKDGDYAKAKTDCGRLEGEFKNTEAYKRGARMCQEAQVVGKNAPTEVKFEKWFQGESDFNINGGKATLYVFWEVWCPHCRREVPALQARYEKYHGQGLELVGLTKISRGKTEADVQSFLEEQKVTYPIAKETGDMSTFFAVSGIPAAAVVKDGKVVWRGHPGQLDDATLEGFLGTP